MKIIISNSTLKKIILEQPESVMDRRVGIERTNMRALGYNPSSHSDMMKYRESVFGRPLTPHEALTILQIGAAFIPLVGPFISAGIGMADAALYYKEGDTKTAGMVAMFSLLPGSSAIISKIPGVKSLGTKGMAELGKKIVGGQRLTKAELQVSTELAKNPTILKSEVEALAKSTASKTINSVKNEIVKNKIKNIAVNGLVTVGTGIAQYKAYDKAYDQIQKDTPKLKAEKEKLDWPFVKQSFGSSGSYEDNKKLKNAWDKGWRPGKIVPQEFQTDLYKKSYQEEYNNILALNKLLET